MSYMSSLIKPMMKYPVPKDLYLLASFWFCLLLVMVFESIVMWLVGLLVNAPYNSKEKDDKY